MIIEVNDVQIHENVFIQHKVSVIARLLDSLVTVFLDVFDIGSSDFSIVGLFGINLFSFHFS